jgi:predicted choloylglycine hydrolase
MMSAAPNSLDEGFDWLTMTKDLLRRYAPDEDTAGWWDVDVPDTSLRLVAVPSQSPADLAPFYVPLMPAFRAWFTRPDARPRSSLAESRRQLATHMPELISIWEELRPALAADDDVLAAFLTMWNPPSITHNCSSVVIPGDDPLLARNYDYDPSLIDGIVIDSNWLGRRVLGTADQVWGLLDGVNDSGLAVGFTFGGRPEVAEGFGIPLVIRYLLQTCEDVSGAISTLRRLPIHVSYNISMVDASGDFATVYVGPHGKPMVTRELVTTNHQERVHWPEHAAKFTSVERAERLTSVISQGSDAEGVVGAMLQDPVRVSRYREGFGTIYTAVYCPLHRDLSYRWPEESWHLELGRVQGEQREIRLAEGATTRWDAWQHWVERGRTSDAAGRID